MQKNEKTNYIPARFLVSILLIILETLAVLAVTILCGIFIPYFYLAMIATEVFCVFRIINSQDNPDYKIPWLVFVLVVPIAGFMIYFMFYDRMLSGKYIKRLEQIDSQKKITADSETLQKLKKEDLRAYRNASLLCKLSDTCLYQNTDAEYFEMGEKMFPVMLDDLRNAETFIFLEYFIIEEGKFWNSILDILREKAGNGVEVRVVYDDIGCMGTLPGDYYRTLGRYGIKAVCFSRLKGQANNEFNNRSHRKIMVIDGAIGYTGGVNLADEYINEKRKFGLWKDVGIRLRGEAVIQMTSIFLADYEMNVRTPVEDFAPYLKQKLSVRNNGYMIPFGDGPKPMFQRQVAKTMIMGMLNQAERYVYMMSPYLIIDNELCQAIENAAMRGVDVRIVTPHIPDRKIIFVMTRSYYKRLLDAGVKVYEFEPGFCHAKVYLSDDRTGIVGTINLDYRSLVHHFENGVWLYKHEVLDRIRSDMEATIGMSIEVSDDFIKNTWWNRFIRAVVYTVAPLL